ncbi:glycosyltransferase family 2 protein [Paenibacillus jiagnxiensis]|uniref:glycosyltransferase family 2 protein n=1 Tax=Paenibacillus jiagnxiensis TaxID=3228926 RepID=UPI0033AEA406
MGSMITVLITFYNPGRYIIDALNSIFNQTYSDWKILLVDDASTDNSSDLIQSYLQDPRVTLIRHSANQGHAKSLNTGLQQINTPFFVQLDADDWFYPDTLQALMREAVQQPQDVAVLSGNINFSFEDALGNVTQSIIRKGRSFSDPYDFIQANSSVWPRCYRTSILKEIGGWPTDIPYDGRYVEDMSILLRLIVNYRFHWIDELMLYHRRHQTNNTNDKTEIAITLRWIIEETLKSWGDIYKPVFHYDNGYISLAGLQYNSSNYNTPPGSHVLF